MHFLQMRNAVRPSPTTMKLENHSTIKLEWVTDDLVIWVDSWDYRADFVVLHLKTKLGGHPLILGRPWLATTDAFIIFKFGSMTSLYGYETKELILYPHATPTTETKYSLLVEYDDESA